MEISVKKQEEGYFCEKSGVKQALQFAILNKKKKQKNKQKQKTKKKNKKNLYWSTEDL